MKLETSRLILWALNAEELELLLNDLPAFEKLYHCQYRAEELVGFFRDISEHQLEKVKQDQEHYVWHTFFMMLRKEDNVIVGSADYKDVPRDGCVEIGYGLSPAFEHQGYMTETVQALCDYAFKQGVFKVIAETEKDNLPSQNVLKRNGFTLCREEDTFWWEKRIIKDVSAGLIWKEDKFLICQRPASKKRGLLWEFVGGKVENGETKEQALTRECKEELDVTVAADSIFMEVDHIYDDITIHLTLFNAHITDGKIKLLEHADAKWITPNEIKDFDFCPADREMLERIQKNVR